MPRYIKRFLVMAAFVAVYFSGTFTVWMMPGRIPEIMPLFAIVWMYVTLRLLRYFFIKSGWTTEESER